MEPTEVLFRGRHLLHGLVVVGLVLLGVPSVAAPDWRSTVKSAVLVRESGDIDTWVESRDAFEVSGRALRLEASPLLASERPEAQGLLLLRLANSLMSLRGDEKLAEAARLVDKASGLLSGAGTEPAFSRALELMRARLALRKAPPMSSAGLVDVRVVASISEPDWSDAARAIGASPHGLARLFAMRAWAHELQPEGDTLAARTLRLGSVALGEPSLELARLYRDMASDAAKARPEIRIQWIDASVRILTRLDDSGTAKHSAKRVEYPSRVALRAARAGQELVSTSALEIALTEVRKLAALAADHDTQTDLAQAWADLALPPKVLGRYAKVQEILESAYEYAIRVQASKVRFELARDLALSQLSASRPEEAARWIDAVDQAARAPDLQSGDRKRSESLVAGLRRVREAMVNDELPAEALMPADLSALSNYALVPLLSGDASMTPWLRALAAPLVTPSSRSRKVHDAVERLRSGKLVLSPANRAALLFKWVEAALNLDAKLASQRMADPLLSPEAVGRWPPLSRWRFAELEGYVRLEQGQDKQATAAFTRAVETAPSDPSELILGPLHQLVGLHLATKNLDQARASLTRMSTVTLPGPLLGSGALARALAASKIARAEGRDVEARSPIDAALRAYVGAPAITAAELYTSAVSKAIDTNNTASGPELQILVPVLDALVELNDDTCSANVDDAVATFFASQLANLHLTSRNARVREFNTWQYRIGRAELDGSTIDRAIELSIRAQAAGRTDLAMGLYQFVQRLQTDAQQSLPFPAREEISELREVAQIQSALIERVLLSEKPQAVARLISGVWARPPESNLSSIVYGRGFQPEPVVHVLTYGPTLVKDRCDVAHRKSRQVAVFVVRQGRLVAALAGPAVSQLESDTAALFGQISKRSAITSSQEGQRLYDVLFKQVLPLLPGEPMLNLLWDPLLPPMPVRVLLDQYSGGAGNTMVVRHLPQAAIYERLRAQKPALAPAVVLAAPDFGEPTPGMPFQPPLKYARREGEVVASLTSASLMEGASASVDALLKIRKPALLHLSTHSDILQSRTLAAATLDSAGGDSQRTAPLRALLALTNARLALARANEQGAGVLHGGGVTAFVFAGLDLKGTGLTVFSSCESAVGTGIFPAASTGLLWAAHQAGSKSAVGTLWKIDEASSAYFMARFYEFLVRGIAPAQALVLAQDAMQRGPTQPQLGEPQYQPQWREPYYWGGYVVSGTNETIFLPAAIDRPPPRDEKEIQ